MNWSVVAIVGLLAAAAQTTLASRVAIGAIRPDWLLVLTVFFGLYGRRREALICGWALGVLADLLSIERPGVMSAAYAFSALAANGIRDAVYLRNAATHFAVTALIGVFVYAGLTLYRAAVFPLPMGASIRAVLSDAGHVVYSCAWAIPIDAILLRLAAILGLRVSRAPDSNPPRRRGPHV
ncbi:MAG: rod shape-determining protein MreD [Phycisphaerales bacterium]|nr:rod shape-determining protein MreD [Phycisphaerales bacterium]